MAIYLAHRYCVFRIHVFDIDGITVIGDTIKDRLRFRILSAKSLVPALFKDLRAEDRRRLAPAAVDQLFDRMEVICIRFCGKPLVDDQESWLCIGLQNFIIPLAGKSIQLSSRIAYRPGNRNRDYADRRCIESGSDAGYRNDDSAGNDGGERL